MGTLAMHVTGEIHSIKIIGRHDCDWCRTRSNGAVISIDGMTVHTISGWKADDTEIEFSAYAPNANHIVRFEAKSDWLNIAEVEIYGRTLTFTSHHNPVRFVKVLNGEHCPTIEQRITSESDCMSAASALGLQWAHSWNGINDVPGCIFADDGRSLVYWNSAQNNRDIVNPQYAEICHQSDSLQLMRTTTTIELSGPGDQCTDHSDCRLGSWCGGNICHESCNSWEDPRHNFFCLWNDGNIPSGRKCSSNDQCDSNLCGSGNCQDSQGDANACRCA